MILFVVGRFGNYHFVLAKRQFVAMHYSCFCVKLLFLHIVQRPHPTPILQDESCVNLKISKKHREPKQKKENQRGQCQNHQKPLGKQQTKHKKQNFWTYVAEEGHRSKSFVFVRCFWFSRWFLIVFALTSLVVLVSLVLPMAFDMFKCTLDSSKRLGRGCAPLLNKAFHLTRVSMYKRLPCIIDFTSEFPL